jgi:hypothetical protein
VNASVQEFAADALGRKAATLHELNLREEAIQCYQQLLQRFGDAEESVGATGVGAALIGKAFEVQRHKNSPEWLLKRLAEESAEKLQPAGEPAD